MKIRPYRETDWQRLCAIHDAARQDELRLTVGTDAFLTLEQSAAGEGLFDDKVCVAEIDDTVHGFVAYTDDELTWLYVDPASYGRGVGRALLRHAIADSAPLLTVELLEGNAPALNLYRSEGFSISDRIEGRLEGNEAFPATGLILTRSP